MAQTGTDL